MTTYVLSQHASYWHMTRYADEKTEPLGQSTSEQAAFEAILKRAIKDKPSQILRINLNGDSKVVAKFDDTRFDLDSLAKSGITVSPAIFEVLKDLQK